MKWLQASSPDAAASGGRYETGAVPTGLGEFSQRTQHCACGSVLG
jgi:hypothetical protein